MAIWLFRKKSAGRKRPRSGHSMTDAECSSPRQYHYADGLLPSSKSPTPRTPLRKSTLKKRRTEPPKNHPNPRWNNSDTNQNDTTLRRSYSFAKDQPDEIRISPRSPTMAVDAAIWEAPTLSPRRSKKAKNGKLQKNTLRRDLAREAEIRALSALSNNRPMSIATSSRRRRNHSKSRHRARSVCSEKDDEFPSPESLRSSMSSDGSDAAAFRVTALGSLVPHPTLRYTSRPHWSPLADHTPASKSQKTIDLPASTANMRSRARINELADDFDSSDLRTLMERDKRRRERKHLRDQERAAERIARKRAEQRELVERAVAAGTPPPRNMDRGVLGRELMEPAEIFPDSESAAAAAAAAEADADPSSENAQPATPQSLCDSASVAASFAQENAADMAEVNEDATSIRHSETSGLADCTSRSPNSAAEDAASTEPQQQSQQSQQQLQLPTIVSSTPTVHLRARHQASSVSFTPTLSPSLALTSDAEQSSSSTRGHRSLRTLLRWGSRKRKHSAAAAPPSSFSNISREVMAAEAARSRSRSAAAMSTSASTATVTVTAPSTPRYDATDYDLPIPSTPTRILPRRTLSRFREDLPELPISPPASPPPPRENDLSTIMSVSERLSVMYSVASSPASGSGRHARHRSIDALTCASPAPSCDAEDEHDEDMDMDMDMGMDEDMDDSLAAEVPSPEPHSLSMASIDSEAEWLSGRISRGTRRHYASSEWTHEAGLSTGVSMEEGYLHGYSSYTQQGDEDVVMTSDDDDDDENDEEDVTRTVEQHVRVGGKTGNLAVRQSFDSKRRSTSTVVGSYPDA